MKKILTSLLISIGLSSVIMADSLNKNDFQGIFHSSENLQVIELTSKEMSQTEGSMWWFYPLLVEYGIIAPTVTLTATQVSQILRKVPITQILNSTKSYRLRNQIQEQVKNILD